jgi:hypothetical protein
MFSAVGAHEYFLTFFKIRKMTTIQLLFNHFIWKIMLRLKTLVLILKQKKLILTFHQPMEILVTIIYIFIYKCLEKSSRLSLKKSRKRKLSSTNEFINELKFVCCANECTWQFSVQSMIYLTFI